MEADIGKRRHFTIQRPSDLYKIRLFIASNGERIPLLVGGDGLPIARPNQYVLVRRRPRCEPSTLEKELRSIAALYAWTVERGIDLEDRFSTGRAISVTEAEDLIQSLRADLERARHQDMPAPTVANPTWAGRLRVARDFIAWNLERSMDACDIGSLRYEHLREIKERLHAKITSSIPEDVEGSREGLPPHLRSRLAENVQIDSPENPWQRSLRRRNRLLIELLSKMGARRGESLKILVSETTTGPRALVRITRDRDDLRDPRKYEPRAKTHARSLPLGRDLAALFDDYLLNERRTVPGAKRSPYLFLSRTGAPLSLNGLSEILKQLIRRHPEFRDVLSPHVLRHTATDLWWREMQQSELPVDNRREILNYLMGWSPSSGQSTKYAKGEIERAAQAFALDAQAALFADPADEKSKWT